MSQQVLTTITSTFSEEINQIFEPGKTWSDSTGIVYNVESP